ncbi:hypothetical protein ACRRTK_008826 [Alexandromys fortis]
MCKLEGAWAVHREPSRLAEGIPDYIAIDAIGVVPAGHAWSAHGELGFLCQLIANSHHIWCLHREVAC